MTSVFRCLSSLFHDTGARRQLRRRAGGSSPLMSAGTVGCERLEHRQLLSAAGFGVDADFGVDVTSDIVYRSDAEVGFGTPDGVSLTDLHLDLYTPTGPDLPALLPGAILIHGGGFVGGDKAQQSFVDLANDFASRGYVTVSINYRLQGDNPPPALPNPPLDEDPLYDTIVAGIEDVFYAIDWMKSSAASLNIDPDRIVLGGHSAGGFLANYGGMVDAADLVGLTDIPLDISSLDVAAVLDGAGGINGQEHIIDANDPSTFILHSTDDPTVLIEQANIIAAELAADGVPFEFPVITDAGHSLDAKLDTVIDGTTARQQMFEFFEAQLDLDGLLPPVWSTCTTSPFIDEGAAGSEYLIYSLSGTFDDGEQASVQLILQDVTTDPTDYANPGLTMIDAVNAYSGPGSLSFDPFTGNLTYTGGAGGTSMADLLVPIEPIDDQLFEHTETLEVSLNNPTGATVDPEQSLATISILDNDGTALDRYVAKPDSTYDYQLIDTIVESGLTTYVIDMTSQTWRSVAEVDRPVWEHEVHIFVPDGTTSDTVILYIGSGDNGDANQAIERANAEDIALHTGQAVLYLPTVPNQPLMFTDDGIARREDSILAYTFDKYLDGGDEEWPALLPMVKSAVRAMDTAQDFLAENTTLTATDFFVTGGSKRGWTTWLTGAVDPRVSAITPVVYDYVNSVPVLDFHTHVYDGVTQGTVEGYAETLQDYVNFDIFDRIATPEYAELTSIIDPYSYRDRLTQPKFAVLSTGDQFMPMAAQFYINDFQGPTYLRYIPNTGHEAGRTEGKGFFKALDAGESLPTYSWTVEGANSNTIRLNSTTAPVEVNLWQATNLNSLDFRINYFGANWTSTTLADQGGGEYVGTVPVPASGGTAFLVEMKYDVGGEILTFTTEAQVVEAPTTAIQSGSWHDPNTWDNGVPDAFSRAIIGDGITVTMDGVDHVAREVIVHGTLRAAEAGQLTPVDGGFEDPVQPDNTFEQGNGTGDGDLTGSAWTITAGAGITRNLSGFQNDDIPAPEGVQHGLIQGTGEFRQSVSGFELGMEYEFSLHTMARQFDAGGNNLQVILDAGLATEMTLIDLSEVTFDSFTEVISPAFVASKDSYTLTIRSDLDGGTLTGDRTTMVDDARFRQTSVATNELTAQWIHVNSGGIFQIGTQDDRFDAGEFVVTLTGTDKDADHVIETTTGTINVTDNDGFLMTAIGGGLQFFGEDKITFTRLAATAEVGSSAITVENVIERNHDGTTSAASDGQLNWEVGDTIVIASSSYDYSEEEVRTITNVNNTGSQTVLTLDAALDHRHYGEIETYGNGTRTWDIDLRAEVALLNRSITIQGTQDTDNSFGDRAQFGTGPGQNEGVGAHAMFMNGSGQITIDSVRFDKMGQTATLGRYPIHWHVAGDRTGDILRNSSVTNSNNRGVTIHGAQNIQVEGNVLHDIHGHGFFMEDAAETGNEFLNNVTFGIHKVGGGFAPNDPFVVPGITRGPDGKVDGLAPQNGNGEGSHDSGQNAPQRFVHSAAYWITNPDNTWVGNIAAGSEGTGFWFILPDEVLGLSKDTGLYGSLNPRVTNLRQFDYNTAHSGQVGMTFDRGEDISGGPQNNGYAPPQLMQTNFFTGYKNHGTAVYHRGPDAIFNESRFADNAFSSFNTFRQQEHNILFVGHSRGNAEPETTVGGYRLYDGPGRIFDSHFAGFTADNAHAFRVEGGANKFSHTTAEGISFEDDGTADKLGIEIYGDNFISLDESPVFVAGRPDSFSGLVYDVDGSLTGHGGGGAGYVLTPKVDFYRDSTDLTPAGWNGYLSDDRYAQFRIGRINDVDAVDNYIPPFRISNGDGHSIIADRWNQTFVQRMYVKLNAGDYTVEFLNGIPDDGFDIKFDATTVTQPGDATVFRIVDAGRGYQPDQGTEVLTVDALRASGSNAWLRAANGDLWLKIFESPATITMLPTSPLVVTNTNDAGAGSLRAAIDTANSNAGIDTIVFDIGAGGSTQTIQPLTPLPVITDRVYIDGTSQTVMTIADGGFETAVQPDNSWELASGSGTGDLSGSPWSFTGGAGITRNLSAFQRSLVPVSTLFVPAPEGQQHALIQGTGSATQTVTGFETGRTYDLNLLAMARQASDLGGSLQVILDEGLATEMVLVDIPEVTFTRFTEVVSSEFTATKNSYTLTIASNPGANGLTGDRTTFVDNLRFRRVGPAIELDGSQTTTGSGLTISGGGSGVKLLTINSFAAGAGIHLHTTDGNVIEDVWAGVDVDGITAAANLYGIGIESSDNAVLESVLASNIRDGIAIGATSTGNTLSRNLIRTNGDLGIDLNEDGVTLNDALDPDSGANNLSNFPVILQAVPHESGTTIDGTLNALPNTVYQLEFFANTQLNPSGYGEGATFLTEAQVTTDGAGDASFSIVAPLVPFGTFITATATDEEGNTSEFAAGKKIAAQVTGRHVFYNGSRYDDPNLLGDEALNEADDGAIDSSKTALLPGTLASFANYTGYSRGINGIMIDLADAPGPLTLADFEFRVGNSADPSGWSLAPAAADFDVRPGDGTDGADRVSISWTDGVIRNQWLQVTVLANANTGLAVPEVHYWGNQVGETGNSPTTSVDGSDVGVVINNPSGFTPAEVTNPYDINKSGFVDGADTGIVVNNPTGFVSLLLFVPPIPVVPAGAPGAAADTVADAGLLTIEFDVSELKTAPATDAEEALQDVEAETVIILEGPSQEIVSSTQSQPVEDELSAESVESDSTPLPTGLRRPVERRPSRRVRQASRSQEEQPPVEQQARPVTLPATVDESLVVSSAESRSQNLPESWGFSDDEKSRMTLRLPDMKREDQDAFASIRRRRRNR